MDKRYFIMITLLAAAVLASTYQAVDGRQNVIIPNAALIIASKPPVEMSAENHTASKDVKKTAEAPPAPDFAGQETVSEHAKQDLAAVDYFNLGISMFNEGMYKQAAGAFHEVLKITPGYGDAYYNLALAHVAMGDGNAAFKDYRLLRNISPEAAEGLYNEIKDYAMSNGDNQFAVQVGAYRNSIYAETMIEKLKNRYFHAYIEKTDNFNKVRIGGLKSRDQAERLMLDIEDAFHIKPYLVRLR